MRVQLLQHQTIRLVSSNLLSAPAMMFGGLMLSNVIAYGYHMAVARMLSPAEYGGFVALLSLSYVLAVLMRTFQAWVITSVTGLGQADERRVGRVFGVAIRTLVPLGVFAFALHWLLAGQVAGFLHLGETSPVVALGLYTFMSFLVPIPRGIMIGLKQLRLVSAMYLLDPLARVAAGCALVAWGQSTSGAILGFSAGNAAVFLVGVAVLWPLIRQGGGREALPRGSGEHYAAAVLVINSCLALMAGIDQIAVTHFFPSDVAGNFAVAYLLGQIITMSTTALGWVIFARSATDGSGGAPGAGPLTRGLLVIGAISGTLTAGYLLAPALATRLMGGAQYTSAHAYVGLVGIEMTLFALTYVQVYYHIAVRRLRVAGPLCLAVAAQVLLVLRFHATIEQVLLNMIAVFACLLAWVSALSWRMVRSAPRSGGAGQLAKEDL